MPVLKRLSSGKSSAIENYPHLSELDISSEPNSAMPSELHPPRGLNLSVFIFGFDSLSRMAWLRLLPKSREYFTKQLGGIELEGK